MDIFDKDSKIIPPLSDFGFKNLFGKEGSEDNLIFLLNEILKEYPDMSPIVEVKYRNSEHQADNPSRKSTRFDIYCRTQTGDTFIIEMQNEGNSLIKKRLVFYLCQAVTEQDSRTDELVAWNYDFPPVIVIMICNFIDREIDPGEVNYFGFMNLKTHRPLGHYVGVVMLQLPFFPKEEKDCVTELEKIFYSLTHMERITKQGRIPFSKQEGDFYDRIARMSSTAALTRDELHEYHQWLKVTNDDRLRLQEAKEEGEKIQAWKTAKVLFNANMTWEFISEATGITIDELKEKLG